MKEILLVMLLLAIGQLAFGQNSAAISTNSAFTNRKNVSYDKSFVGTWKLVAVDNIYNDGRRLKPYGAKPYGILMFDRDGNYSLQILKEGRKKIAADNKTKATTEEFKAMSLGGNSHFGKYKVDKTKNIVNFFIHRASYPNWEGITQRRSYTLKNGVLTYSVPTTTNGKGVRGEVTWKRVK